jgi:hypothetical protein
MFSIVGEVFIDSCRIVGGLNRIVRLIVSLCL